MTNGGHFPAEIGRAMEDSFANLLFRLGYAISIRCDVKTSLDVIAAFYGTPIKPTPRYPCSLLPPFFAPKGLTAFSLKRSHFGKKDVNEFLDNVKKARALQDKNYSIDGLIIASNFSQKESGIDNLLKQGIFCWDGRRLIFYSGKVQTIQNFSNMGPITETAVDEIKNTSCLIEAETSTTVRNTLLSSVAVFIDDHDKNLTLGAQHIDAICNHVYKEELALVEKAKFDVQISLTIHALGIANEEVMVSAYKKFLDNVPQASKIFFPAEYTLLQYGAAPWSILLG